MSLFGTARLRGLQPASLPTQLHVALRLVEQMRLLGRHLGRYTFVQTSWLPASLGDKVKLHDTAFEFLRGDTLVGLEPWVISYSAAISASDKAGSPTYV